MNMVNGDASTVLAKVDATAADKARALLDSQIRNVVGITVRGLLVSAPGVPPQEVLNSIARVTGGLLADSIVADLSAHFRMRKGFRDAFDEGLKAAPLKQSDQNAADRG